MKQFYFLIDDHSSEEIYVNIEHVVSVKKTKDKLAKPLYLVTLVNNQRIATKYEYIEDMLYSAVCQKSINEEWIHWSKKDRND